MSENSDCDGEISPKSTPIIKPSEVVENIEIEEFQVDKLTTDKHGWELTKEMSKTEDMSIYNAVLNRHKELYGEQIHNKKIHYLSSIESIKVWHTLLLEECEKINKVKKEKKEKEGKKLLKTQSNINDYLVRANSSIQSQKKADLIKNKLTTQRENEQYKELLTLLTNKKLNKSLNDSISNITIIEYILIYYMHFVNKSYKYIKKEENIETNISLYYNSIFSLRDCYKDNNDLLEKVFKEQIEKFLEYYNNRFDYYNLIDKNSHYIFNNHYKNHFKHNIKLYKEQEQLLDSLEENEYKGLYIVSWSVGSGKTALVAPLSYLIHQNNKRNIIFYCISKPPVKDQTAANMYRCGIPFAYIEQVGEQHYVVNPSYFCKNKTQPIIYIVQNQFMVDYIKKKDNINHTLLLDIPFNKKDYNHLEDLEENLYKYDYSLIIDEPDGSCHNLLYILDNLPKLTILMSATSYHLLNDKRIIKYMRKYSIIDKERYICHIKMKDIKITTTLIGYWNDKDIILSPYSNSKNKNDLDIMTQIVELDPIYRRFLSPQVFIDLYNKINNANDKDYYNRYNITLKLDNLSLKDLTLNNLVYEIINFIKSLIKNDKITDEVIEKLFKVDINKTKSQEQLYKQLLISETSKFMGGALIGTSNIDNVYKLVNEYKMVDDELTNINDIFNLLSKKTHIIKTTIKKELVSLNGLKKQLKKGDDDPYIATTRQGIYERNLLNHLPINTNIIINTKSFLEKNDKENTNTNYMRPLTCIENGNIYDNIDKWSYDLDTTLNVSQDKELCRLVGIGSINENNRLFYMKNIKDLNQGQLAYNISDSSGAFGLNLKIQSLILMEDILEETKEVILQKIGRVGRPGQLSTGYVYLTDYKIFEKIFSNLVVELL